MTKMRFIQFVSIILTLASSSCSFHKDFEANILSQSNSLATFPVSRQHLVKVFELESVPSKVGGLGGLFSKKFYGSQEIWSLKHGYKLIASDNANLKQSANSKLRELEWRKTLVGRDYFVLDFDPILSFNEVNLISPKGEEIYTSKSSNYEIEEQDTASKNKGSK